MLTRSVRFTGPLRMRRNVFKAEVTAALDACCETSGLHGAPGHAKLRHCAANRHQPTAAFAGASGVNIRAKVGMTSRLQMGERSMPPTITQARGC